MISNAYAPVAHPGRTGRAPVDPTSSPCSQFSFIQATQVSRFHK